MAGVGSFVHFILRNSSGMPGKLTGRVVEAGENSVVVAVLTSKVPAGVDQSFSVPGASDQPGLTFLGIASEAYSSLVPAGWTEERSLPPKAVCKAAWASVEATGLESSEADRPACGQSSSFRQQEVQCASRPRSPCSSNGGAGGRIRDGKQFRRRRSRAPSIQFASGSGQEGSQLRARKAWRDQQASPKAKGGGCVLSGLMEEGLRKGQSPTELFPLMMAGMMMQQQQQQQNNRSRRRKGRRRSSSRRQTAAVVVPPQTPQATPTTSRTKE